MGRFSGRGKNPGVNPSRDGRSHNSGGGIFGSHSGDVRPSKSHQSKTSRPSSRSGGWDNPGRHRSQHGNRGKRDDGRSNRGWF